MQTPRTQWPNVILGTLGAAISAYSIHVHNLAKAGKDTGCGFTETISCDKVLTSKWAELFGIPIGYFGILFFAIIAIMAIATKETKTTPRQFALQNLVLSSMGFLGSIALTYISIQFIGAKCPVCMATHTVTTLLFIFSLRAYLRSLSSSRVSSSE
ncbi:MAG TPA: vitamin K epoxide reductase family protein [Abditibacteriaceae bacterium]